jgi:KDO2-lipid IV(A) lauroyltransferase
MLKTSFKKFRQGFGDALATVLFTLSLPIFRSLPPKALVFIAKILGTFAFYTIKKYRNRVFENLSIAFGKERDPKEMRTLARDIFFNFTLTPLETIYVAANPFQPFLTKIKIEGRQYLEGALSRGKGVIALGSHLGSFTLLGTRLAFENYPFNIIINEDNFPKLTKRLMTCQRRLGQKPFPPRPITTSVKKSLNCLRRNEILYLIADEQQRRGGLPVPFFGQTAYTPPGPAIFSLKTGAPILPMFVVREKGIPKTLFIGSPIEIERILDQKRDTERLTAKFTRAIEDSIRQYPSQWPWLNRRWKLPPWKRES